MSRYLDEDFISFYARKAPILCVGLPREFVCPGPGFNAGPCHHGPGNTPVEIHTTHRTTARCEGCRRARKPLMDAAADARRKRNQR